MLKRILDFIVGFFGFTLASPFIVIISAICFIRDIKSPLRYSERLGLDHRAFSIVELAITDTHPQSKIAKWARKLHVNGLSKSFNLMNGEISLVGPEPHYRSEIATYTLEEQRLFEVKPGLIDFSSIVFADTNELLKNSKFPERIYHQEIRPWKNRLGLLYADNQSFSLDTYIIYLSITHKFSRAKALNKLCKKITKLGASEELIKVCYRNSPLPKSPPPGSDKLITGK